MSLLRNKALALTVGFGVFLAAPLQADQPPAPASASSTLQWGAAPPPSSSPANGSAAAQPATPATSAPGDTATASAPAPAQAPGEVGPQTYTMDETLTNAQKFFGGTTEGLAKAVEKAFHDLGAPNAYIVGNEGSGAFFVGLRYGEGQLYYKGGGSTKVYWQGPSVGFDWGGNASKVFTLVYNLHWTRDLYQRFPGVDGSLYIVAGLGLNYQRSNDITLAPIRTGVGVRAGASVGYLAYTQRQSWNPF
jgi:hypothetical protein